MITWAIVAAASRSDRRGDHRRYNRHDDRLVYTLQATVAATIASWLLDLTGVRRHDDHL